ncbi:NADPH-dependent F420 reductase [Rufibacter tibetensis]|uniref:NADP oxidoreductase n=1 Tax=Rufibacter tibetensis TaxID=512763 RepID=A0A0P0CR12_9BACT|nr:NADP oxidoreductase [Rufibacter tibetensis]
MKTSIGIIGAGNIGKTAARHFVKAGYQVILSNSHGPESLQETILSLGGNSKAGTREEAAQADIVLLALPWSQLESLTTLTDWTDRIVIDATNHFITYAPDFQVADLGGRASSEVVQELLPGARVVKAFNTLYFKVLQADPAVGNGHRVLFLSGDDASAKAVVREVISSIGFAPVDLGTLDGGGKLQQAKGQLATLNFIQL